MSVLLFSANALAEQITIDFEDLPDGIIITNQYDGVVFNGAKIIESPAPTLAGPFWFGYPDLDDRALTPSDGILLEMTFDRTASDISFDYSQVPGTLTIETLDESGDTLSTDIFNINVVANYPISLIAE